MFVAKVSICNFLVFFCLEAIQKGNGGCSSFLKINQTGFLALRVTAINLKLSQVR